MKTFSASEITTYALKRLDYLGNKVWRQNQVRVPGRAFTGQKGLSDIQGYHRISGIACYCEVKTLNDKLSKVQIEFLTESHNSGCFCLVATQEKDEIILLPFLNYIMK